MGRLTARERGGRRANPKAEAVLKHAEIPITMLGRLRDELAAEWASVEEIAATGLHPRLQEHEAREGPLRVAR